MVTARTWCAGLLAAAAVLLTACHGAASTGPATSPTSSGNTVAPSTTPAPLPSTSAQTNGTTGPATRSTSSTSVTTQATTRQVLLTPVTAAGDLSPGWSHRDGSITVDCSAGIRSPVAQGDGVLSCSPSAASAIACWRARDRSHAYCLVDPRSHTVVQYALDGGAFGATGPAELEPRPIALDLATGGRCTVRDSGAAGRLAGHPDWTTTYFCGNDAVWAAPDSVTGGITRGDGRWTVSLATVDGSGELRTTQVVTAYLVGTA